MDSLLNLLFVVGLVYLAMRLYGAGKRKGSHQGYGAGKRDGSRRGYAAGRRAGHH
jgi:hypothetical protein